MSASQHTEFHKWEYHDECALCDKRSAKWKKIVMRQLLQHGDLMLHVKMAMQMRKCSRVKVPRDFQVHSQHNRLADKRVQRRAHHCRVRKRESPWHVHHMLGLNG